MLFTQANIQKIRQIFINKPSCHLKTKNLKNKDHAVLQVKIIKQMPFLGSRGIKILTIDEQSNKFIDLVFFHRRSAYLKKIFPENSIKIISGKVQIFGNKIQFAHPEIIAAKNIDHVQKIKYKNENNHVDSLKKSLDAIGEIPEWIDENLFNRFRFPSFLDAIHDHFFNNNAGEISLTRLAYDEIFSFQLSLQIIEKKQKKYIIRSDKFAQQLIANLEFELTNDQQKSLQEIYNDQKNYNQMLRLLQGDVGSGKTIVALCAILNVVENGGQIAFLAPTESLARQHKIYIEDLLKKSDLNHIHCDIFVSEMRIGKKREVLERIQSGCSQIIVGTHALFFDKIEFTNLELIVIDEQQRFGVLQRLKLAEKGENPDVLLLTATPIPRTEMIMKYGQIDCSLIKQKPKNRLSIHTSMLKISSIPKLIERLKKIIDQEKIFWVCPLIEESDFFDLSDITKRFEFLQQEFGDKVSLIHGRMKNIDVQNEIEKFRNNEIRILIATSIIEVGIHVPDASIIVIENAERFGLSSLHQLRGRVGRGSKKSFCILLHVENLSKTGFQRLITLCKSNDGFFIAEQDLQIRGAGELFGKMQSGDQNFLFFDPEKHQNLLKIAIQEAQNKQISIEIRDFLLQIFSFENCICF